MNFALDAGGLHKLASGIYRSSITLLTEPSPGIFVEDFVQEALSISRKVHTEMGQSTGVLLSRGSSQ